MPRCSYHPNVETNVRCVECERPICPKDFVSTPVGYKCPDCARQLPSARRTVKPRQLVLATLAALGVGVGGMFLVGLLGIGYWIVTILLGMLTGEAARRASGGHRTRPIAAVAGIGMVLGAILSGAGFVAMVLGAAAASVSVLSGRW
ncbi:MAG TPA: hypothetical protein ENN10_03805 [Actinobacteria bacterium]|nr:hypothetical protein [Actinomycetota bacterium]